MAYEVPRFNEFGPRFEDYVRPLPLPAEPAPPKKRTFDTLSPQEREAISAQADQIMRQEELAAAPRSALGEIATGLKRGLFSDFPRMAGEMLQAPTYASTVPEPGKDYGVAFNIGGKLQRYGREQGLLYAKDQNEGAHGAVVDTLSDAAAMVAPSVGLPILGGAAGSAVGGPVGGAVGAAAAAGAVFGGSTFTDTMKRGLEAGVAPDAAREAAAKSALLQGGLEAATGPITRGFATTGKAFGTRVLGRKYGVSEALDGMADPQFMRTFAKEYTKTAGVETGTEVVQNYGSAVIEKNAGISQDDPYKAAVDSIAPTMALTTFLAPFGAHGMRRSQQANKAAVAVVNNPGEYDSRTVFAASRRLQDQMEPLVGKDAAREWRLDVIAGEEERAKSATLAAEADTQQWIDAILPREYGRLPERYTDEAPKAGAPQYPAYWDAESIPYEAPVQVGAAPDSSLSLAPTGELPTAPTGERQGGRGGGMAEADASARLAAAAAEAPPNQGTAKALGIFPEVVRPEGSGGGPRLAVAPNRQEQVKALRAKVPGLPMASINEVLNAPAAERADAVGALYWDRKNKAKSNEQLPVYLEHLGALYKELTGKDIEAVTPVAAPAPQTAASTTKEKVNAQPVRQITAASFQDPLVPQGQEGQGTPEAGLLTVTAGEKAAAKPAVPSGQAAPSAPAPLTVAPVKAPETPPAAKVEVPATTTPARRPKSQREAKAQAAAAAQRVAQEPKKQVPPGKSPVEGAGFVTSTGEEVNWGDFARGDPGPFTYETPASEKRAPAAQGTRRMTHSEMLKRASPEVRDNLIRRVESRMQRKGATEGDLYAFELFHYDPNRPRGEAYNRAWVADYSKARAVAQGLNEEGVKVDWLPSEKVDAVKAKANAQAALDWLYRYSPQEVALAEDSAEATGAPVLEKDAAGRAVVGEDGVPKYRTDAQGRVIREGRVTQVGRIHDVNALLHDVQDRLFKDIKRKYHDAARLKKAQETGKAIDKVRLTPKEEAEVERLARFDPGFEYLHEELPNYTYSDSLAQVVGTGNLDAVLGVLEANGPTQWVKYMAGLLRGMGLQTKITRVDRVMYGENGKRSYGRYNHALNTVRIFLGGENAHTVLHETTHAASIGRIEFALAAERKPASARTAAEKAAVVHLVSLRRVIEQTKKADTRNQYAFKNEKEFIAEVFSNERFQRWLSNKEFDGRSLWQRIKQWFAGLFGRSGDFQMATALEAALTHSVPFLADSRFAAEQGLTFDHSPGGAMAATDSVLATLVKKYDAFAAKHAWLGNMPTTFRKAWLGAATTFHIAQMVVRDKSLRPMAEGITMFSEASDARTRIRQVKHAEFASVLTPAEYALMKHSVADRAALNRKMQEFAGEQSILGIDLNKNFDENLAAKKDLDPALRARVNQLHAEYRSLDPALREAIESSIRVFRKNYIQHTAMVLAANLRSYSKDYDSLVSPFINRLRIDNAALEAGDNKRPDFFFDAYSQNLDMVLQEVFADLRALELKTGEGKKDSLLSQQVEAIEKFYRAAITNPYQHLGRSGDFFVSFSVHGGEMEWAQVQNALAPFGKVIGTPGARRHIFLRFENRTQRNLAYDAIDRLGGAIVRDESNNSLRSGTLFDEGVVTNLQGVPEFIRRIAGSIDTAFPGAEAAEVRQFLKKELLDMMPDTSAQKALAPRKDGGVAGYDADFMRSFAKRAEGAASMLANGFALPMYDEAFTRMKEEVEQLRNSNLPDVADAGNAVLVEMSRRFSNSLDPVDSPIIDKAKALGYNFYLAVSPAFMITNLLQPYHLTLPFLGGRYGFVSSAKEMGRSTAKASRLIKGAIDAGWAQAEKLGGTAAAWRSLLDMQLQLESSGLSGGERRMLQQLMESGQLDTTQSHSFGQLAAGQSQGWSTFMKVLSTGSHYTEVVNRLTAALTAYNMELKKGKSRAPEEKHAEAARMAIEAVRATQYNYADSNIARFMGRHGLAGKVTPLLASFQSYSFQTTELLYRMAVDAVTRIPAGATPEQAAALKQERAIAQKQLAGVMTTTAMVAGTLGLPFVSVFARLADAVLGDDDDPSDVKSRYRQLLAEAFGKDVAEVIARGLPRLLGIDLSSRAGLADLLPGSRFLSDRRAMADKLESGALELLGPAVSAAQDIWVGGSKILDGYVMDGLVQFLPLGLRGPVKGMRMDDTGYTTSSGNALPIEVTPWDEFVQVVGFTPANKAEQSEANFAYRQREGLLQRRGAQLSGDVARAMERGEDPASALLALSAFSAQNPEHAPDISTLLRSRAKARATAEASEATIATLPKYLPLLDRYSYANVK